MRASLVVLFSFSLLAIAGCTCEGPRVRRDTGGLDGGGDPDFDAGPRPDTPPIMFPDVLPMDVPCMVTTPVMNDTAPNANEPRMPPTFDTSNSGRPTASDCVPKRLGSPNRLDSTVYTPASLAVNS